MSFYLILFEKRLPFIYQVVSFTIQIINTLQMQYK